MAETNIEERIEELLSNCRILEEQISEAKIDAGTNTEKELLVRQLTSKKELASTELAELLKEQKEKEYKDGYEAKLKEEEAERRKALEKDFPKSIKDSVNLMTITKILMHEI